MTSLTTTLMVAASSALIALTAHAQPAQNTEYGRAAAAPDRMTERAAPAATNEARTDRTSALAQEDRKFLENAIQGSHAEIEGSQLALEKTGSPEVKHFAEMMIKDHGLMVKEAAKLAQAKGVTPPDGPSVVQTTEITALKALTGGAFDAMYVNRIGVAAHEATVDMFEKASQEVQDADVRAMATEALPKLREHLKMARDLNQKQEKQ